MARLEGRRRGGRVVMGAEVGVAVGSGRWLGAALELDGLLASRGDRGHDPHDYLASPAVRGLTLGNRWLAVAWTQLGKRLPVQLRGVLGVPRQRNAKGAGLVLAAQVRLARAADEGIREAALKRARGLADWLAECGSAEFSGYGWGYPFPWANRDFYAPAGTPSAVVTAFVGHALLDAAEAFGWPELVELAARGGEFIRGGLPRIEGAGGTFSFSYTPVDRRVVHNANLLAASLLARLGSVQGDAALVAEGLRAARFSARAQRGDGAWLYGAAGRDGWVDSFHQSYTLVALDDIRRAAGVSEFDDAIARGYDYWRRAFLVGPAVAFYPDDPYPVDMHAVAHAILTLVRFRGEDPAGVATAARLADWSLREMRHPAGHFYYQRHRRWTNRLSYMRWIQSWMLLALAELAAIGVDR